MTVENDGRFAGHAGTAQAIQRQQRHQLLDKRGFAGVEFRIRLFPGVLCPGCRNDSLQHGPIGSQERVDLRLHPVQEVVRRRLDPGENIRRVGGDVA